MGDTATPTDITATGSISAPGLATHASDGTVLDVWYPAALLGSAAEPPADLLAAQRVDEIRGVTVTAISTTIASLADAPQNTADAYLRLHLLSARLVQPRSINLDGIFGLLPNNVWTNLGPVAQADIDQVRMRACAAGLTLTVTGVDKFPRMTDYVVPSGVRIADADRVRLGAHLAAGTTVMHEGFCNFNAGTLGASMVEGRISQGVLVGDGSDIGGGASIMGTLSGGGKEQITVGARCLLGANSGLGISLGDDCVLEAGLYLTAGTKVTLVTDDPAENGKILKAQALSGADGLLYRRNSLTGGVEVTPRTGAWGGLNAALHAGQ